MTEPVEPHEAWTPSAEQVEAHIPTRGPFDETSTPTKAQVEQLAANVARGLLLDLGTSVVLSEPQLAVARSYVEHATAARVEWGWFPEQQDRDGVGAQQERWAQSELARLRTALGDLPIGSPGLPRGSFPPVQPYDVWGTPCG
jgi:hypothetical protein